MCLLDIENMRCARVVELLLRSPRTRHRLVFVFSRAPCSRNLTVCNVAVQSFRRRLESCQKVEMRGGDEREVRYNRETGCT